MRRGALALLLLVSAASRGGPESTGTLFAGAGPTTVRQELRDEASRRVARGLLRKGVQIRAVKGPSPALLHCVGLLECSLEEVASLDARFVIGIHLDTDPANPRWLLVKIRIISGVTGQRYTERTTQGRMPEVFELLEQVAQEVALLVDPSSGAPPLPWGGLALGTAVASGVLATAGAALATDSVRRYLQFQNSPPDPTQDLQPSEAFASRRIAQAEQGVAIGLLAGAVVGIPLAYFFWQKDHPTLTSSVGFTLSAQGGSLVLGGQLP